MISLGPQSTHIAIGDAEPGQTTYGSTVVNFAVHSDRDRAGYIKSEKSTDEYMILLNGGLVVCRSFKKRCVVTSSMEAEYTSFSECIQAVRYHPHNLHQLGNRRKQPSCTKIPIFALHGLMNMASVTPTSRYDIIFAVKL